MYNNMFNNPQMNIDKINQQIQELERLKTGYQVMPNQPMNVFNVGNTPQIDFEARMLNENEKVEDLLVQRKTAFISLKNRQLSIKEINGDITTYEIILPKDEKDLKIEELERKLKDYEYEHNKTNDKRKSTNDSPKYDKE